MSQVLLFAVLGLGTGAVIAAIGLSLVTTFRGSGVLNLAAGAMSMFTAYVYSALRSDGVLFFRWLELSDTGVGFVPALVLSLVVAAGLGAVLHAAVFGPLRDAPPVAQIVGAVGVLITLQAIVVLRFGADVRAVPDILGSGPGDTVALFGTRVPTNRLELAAIALLTAGALWAVFRYSRYGLATRAAAENERAAMFAGLSPGSLARGNWMLASVLSGLVGIFASPITQLDPVQLTLLVIPALGAALLGGFQSFWIVAFAGLGIGVVQSEVAYLQTLDWWPQAEGLALPGVADGLPFLIIAAVMFARGGSLPERGAAVLRRLPPAPRPDRVLARAAVPAAAAVAMLLVLGPEWRQALTNSTIGVIVCLSLVVNVGYLGQTSLLHMALAGVAGYGLSHLAADFGIPFPLAPVLAILGAAALGAVATLPALRLRGTNLAVITLAGAIAIQEFIFKNPTWGGGINATDVPAPTLFGLDLGPAGSFPIGDGQPSAAFGLLCLGVLLACSAGVVAVRRGRLGQRMLAVRVNERAAAAAGVSVPRTKLVGFVLSAGLAGTAGVLYGYNFGSVTYTRFDVFTAAAFLAFAYLGGITTVTGAVIGGTLVTQGLAFHAMESWLGVPTDYTLLVAGLGLLLTAVLNPTGIAGAARALVARGRQRRPPVPVPAAVAST